MILNLNNNKFYIGSSVNVWKRRSQHLGILDYQKCSNTYLQRAYNKDKKYFIFILLEKVENIPTLIEREQYWMDDLEACKYGYNLRLIAESNLGHKISEETRAKISGRPCSSETRAKISKANTGAIRTEENREKIRKNLTGRKLPEERKKNISDSLKGIKHSEESKKKSKEAKRGKMRPILQFSLNDEFIKEWESVTEIGRNGFTASHVRGCCNGKRNKHKEFKWKYKQILENER